MKTKFFNFVMPLAVVAIGLAGALTSNAMERNAAKSGAVTGWKHTTAIPCVQDQQCSNSGNFMCKALDNVSQLYLQTAPGICPNPLKRNTL